jgi:hypothetical protein
MLRGQSKLPKSDDDYALESMIPEEQLFQAQEAIGQHGAASGQMYSVPSREALKQSGMASLRQLFGVQESRGRAAAYPQQVAGQYGIEREGIRAQGNVEAARIRAEADANQRGASQAFQQGQQERQQTFQAGQSQLSRDAFDTRQAASIKAADAGRQYTQGQVNQRADAKKPMSLTGWIGSLFGGGGSKEAADLAPLKKNPKYASMSFDDLVAQGIVSADSPEELAAYQQAWGQ